MPHTLNMKLTAQCKGFVENGNEGLGIIVGCNAIDRQGFALYAFMDQHQLAARFTLILVPAFFHRQSNRLHRRFARGQAVARDAQIKMTRPQTMRTVVAVVDARDHMRAGNKGMTMGTPEIPEGGSMIFHSS